jgi:6-phosphogluconolactonase
MAREALLDHIPIPAGNIHRLRGEAAPGIAADEYSITLRAICGDPPRLDFVLLGMGPDGHTASLFPGTTGLVVGDRPAVGVYVPRLCTWRISLTFPVINNADRVVFLVTGEDKAKTVAEVFSLDAPDESLPASMVMPHRAPAHWMMDAHAASLLDRKE